MKSDNLCLTNPIFGEISKRMVVIAEHIPEEEPEEVIEVPAYLVRDVIKGVVYPYKGWREVLNKEKTAAEIMGTSGLQAYLTNLMSDYLATVVDKKRYQKLIGEPGNRLAKNTNFSYDIALFSKKLAPKQSFDNKYLRVPPEVVIEVDVNVDTNEETEMEYVHNKINEILSYGVKQVIWVFTKPEIILAANLEDSWRMLKWQEDIRVLDSVVLNLRKLMEEDS